MQAVSIYRVAEDEDGAVCEPGEFGKVALADVGDPVGGGFARGGVGDPACGHGRIWVVVLKKGKGRISCVGEGRKNGQVSEVGNRETDQETRFGKGVAHEVGVPFLCSFYRCQSGGSVRSMQVSEIVAEMRCH